MQTAKKPIPQLPGYISNLTEKAQIYYRQISESLETKPGETTAPRDVLNYVLETLCDIEIAVGDPDTYIETLNDTKIDFVEQWNSTVLSDKNPNSAILKTMGVTGEMAFRWVSTRFQFAQRNDELKEMVEDNQE